MWPTGRTPESPASTATSALFPMAHESRSSGSLPSITRDRSSIRPSFAVHVCPAAFPTAIVLPDSSRIAGGSLAVAAGREVRAIISLPYFAGLTGPPLHSSGGFGMITAAPSRTNAKRAKAAASNVPGARDENSSSRWIRNPFAPCRRMSCLDPTSWYVPDDQSWVKTIRADRGLANTMTLFAATVIGLANMRSRSFSQPARSSATVRGPERRTPVKSAA